MRVLLDNISWDVPEGKDITHLPFLDVVELEDKSYDEDEFWEALFEKLLDRYNEEALGLDYHILEGTLH